jgi:hypothetical protein
MGTLAGVPDLLFFYKGSVLSIELKAKGGRLSPSQQSFQAGFTQNGGTPLVTDSLDSALSFLSIADILR